ncbi:hypothetical protein FDH82_gp58 [Roseobacter phage RDJL Phi 2]|uniref:Uncharacterized protein n=1 Tax=Roseobacter phage RDJL Phi 2 TaxID=1682380 RepID=A0A0K0PWR0_9CAUD|nr:hypothetical protein FDH82_gp58 [Roseobacter phage RDJL Phi 2]AKQ75848.1 hypothetical protein RDJLphi2_gp58 [Roseobacter phage RDJL Phi 2]
MGNKLFGVDIAKIVNTSIKNAGGVLDGTLTKATAGTRTPGSLTGGTNPTDATYAFKGFTETAGERRPGSTTASSISTVSILGDSCAAEPEVNDEVTIDGTDWTLLELVERDPAKALYVFKAEER